MFLYLPNQLTIILRWSELIYYYSDTVEIIVYYVWVCVILGECIEVCHVGIKGSMNMCMSGGVVAVSDWPGGEGGSSPPGPLLN